MGKRQTTNKRRVKKKVVRTNRTAAKRRGSTSAKRVPQGELNWGARYGDLKEYKKHVAIAHRKTHSKCVVCMKRKSQEVHHAFYRKEGDIVGFNTFPCCIKCHNDVCHTKENWIKCRNNPVWGNHNTVEFTKRLRLGYKLLYGGINHA